MKIFKVLLSFVFGTVLGTVVSMFTPMGFLGSGAVFAISLIMMMYVWRGVDFPKLTALRAMLFFLVSTLACFLAVYFVVDYSSRSDFSFEINQNIFFVAGFMGAFVTSLAFVKIFKINVSLVSLVILSVLGGAMGYLILNDNISLVIFASLGLWQGVILAGLVFLALNQKKEITS